MADERPPAPTMIVAPPARQRSMVGRAVAILIILGLIVALPLATTRGCEDNKVDATVQVVRIGGETFHLEVAAKNAVRMKGLGQRDHIEPDGGMLFVFARPYAAEDGGFVMRDCTIPIDIIFLDSSGRIDPQFGTMRPVAPRGPDEGQPGDFNNAKYEERIGKSKFGPRYAYQFAIELKGGTIESKLKGKIKAGDKVDMPIEALKRRAE